MATSDCDLLKLYLENDDKEALSHFFSNQFNRLYRIAMSYLNNSADAEDVLQNAFINIMTKADSISESNLSNEFVVNSWVTRIVINLCKIKLREAKSRHKREQITGNEKMDYANRVFVRNVKEVDENIGSLIDLVIQKLPIKYRMPVHLKYVEDLSYDEISSILKDKPGTIRVRLKRGLDMLKKSLEERGVVVSSAVLLLCLANKKEAVASCTNAPVIIQNAIASEKALVVTKGVGGFSYSFLIKSFAVLFSFAGIAFIWKNMLLDGGQASVSTSIQATTKEAEDIWPKKWDFTQKELANVSAIKLQPELVWDEKTNRYTSNFNEVSVAYFDNFDYTNQPILISAIVSNSTSNVIVGGIFQFAWGRADNPISYKYYSFSHYDIKHRNEVEFQAVLLKDYIFMVYQNQVIAAMEYSEKLEDSKLYFATQNFSIKEIKADKITEGEALKMVGDVINKLGLKETTSKEISK